MGTGILSEFPDTSGSYATYPALHGDDPVQPVHAPHAGGGIPKIRMRILHFENTFGDVCTSEYCLDAMLSLVLLMTRSTRHNAARLERLTEAAHPADYGALPLQRAVRL